MKQGKLIVISGPSGVGKSSVIGEILKRHPDYLFSVSATTRAPRPGEVPGVSYHYITEEKFKTLVAQNALLEYNHYASGDYYGTPAAPILQTIAAGGTALLDVDPNGALQVAKQYPQAVLVFLAPPSMTELRRRLEGRNDTPPEKILARLAQARWEIQQAEHYRYLVLNDDFDDCVARMEEILSGSENAQRSLYTNNSDLKILKEVY